MKNLPYHDWNEWNKSSTTLYINELIYITELYEPIYERGKISLWENWNPLKKHDEKNQDENFECKRR